MKIRTLVFSLLAAMLIMSASAVSAQDTCFGLSADDCAAVAAAGETTAAFTSFNVNLDIDVHLTADGTDVTFNATGSGPVTLSSSEDFPLNLSLPLTITSNTGEGETTQTFELRVVDGILYIQDSASGAWSGMEIAALMENSQALGLPVNPAEMTEPSALGIDMEALGGALPALMALGETPGFLTHVRDGDTFTFTADFGTVLQSPSFTTAATALTTAFAENPDMAQMGAMLPMLPMLVKEAKFTLTQGVDPALSAVTDLTVAANATIDSSMMGGGSSPIDFDFSIHAGLDQVNEDFTIEAPADAQMMPTGG